VSRYKARQARLPWHVSHSSSTSCKTQCRTYVCHQRLRNVVSRYRAGQGRPTCPGTSATHPAVSAGHITILPCYQARATPLAHPLRSQTRLKGSNKQKNRHGSCQHLRSARIKGKAAIAPAIPELLRANNRQCATAVLDQLANVWGAQTMRYEMTKMSVLTKLCEAQSA
jgi:hypothetical protein